uniref:Serine protease EDA2 n=1 Tax=Kalanchoe fedtschenkoi TaxID=63787 RepID=A0A7N1A6R7_KALFE
MEYPMTIFRFSYEGILPKPADEMSQWLLYKKVLAKKFGAAVVSLEHRYYGKSSPFKILTTKNLQFLSSKQALFDLAACRQFYQDSLNLKHNRLNAQNPWFTFGISYSGALSAWFRLKFPHLTCGSLASSAVVEAVYNFTDFDRQIGISAGEECKAALKEINQLVEKKFSTNETELKAMFDASQLQIAGDFLYLLADAAATAFQYGNPDALCSPIVEAKNAGHDLLDAYATYVKDYYIGSFGAKVESYDQSSLKDPSNTDRLWWFQVCTEVAYFQVAPSNDSLRSSKLDARYHLDLCKNVFGEGIYPDVDATNLYYGGKNIAGSKIVFANGSQDPWQGATKQSSSPNIPSYTVTCHNCGHGVDMRGCPQIPLNLEGNAQNCSSPEAVNKTRQHIIDNIDLWLSQCEGKGRKSE